MQNLIWEKYDEVDPIIWHEFFYSRRGLRSPTANSNPDGLEGVQSYRVRRFGDSIDRAVALGRSPLAAAPTLAHRRPRRAYFRARLDLDIFYSTISGAYSNLLGFLSPCAADQKPKPLDDNHWFFKTRKLAIHVSGGFSQDWRGSDFAQDTLTRHKGLAAIYVVSDNEISPGHQSPRVRRTSGEFIHGVWHPHTTRYTWNFVHAMYKGQAVNPDIHLAVEGSPEVLAMMALHE
ncbi:hypothetical protein PG993_011692 [Apiospora rasikravindrae]|uniref:Uncharacterized protein n=1 Tax=Apiospora rasikravindrae TaxID=990691 RepID=A0ABR1S0B9_9PEZI